MKNLKFLAVILIIVFTASTTYGQLRSYNQISAQTQNTSVFLDASASPLSLPANTDLGKGLVFPRTDLTQFNFSPLSSSFFETGYDGMIVYNTTSGSTPGTGSGIGNQDVEPGFYYFNNPGSTGNSATGEWVSFANGNNSRTNVANNTINNTTTIINGVNEKVVLLDGTANGTRTELTLDNSVLAPASTPITRLREARIYDASNELQLIASSDFRVDSGSYIIVTGDGMVNKLLPAATYRVELYFE